MQQLQEIELTVAEQVWGQRRAFWGRCGRQLDRVDWRRVCAKQAAVAAVTWQLLLWDVRGLLTLLPLVSCRHTPLEGKNRAYPLIPHAALGYGRYPPVGMCRFASISLAHETR